jgi:predicted CoA-substrate-specific enzyme activase
LSGQEGKGGIEMTITAGIDLGSTSTKAVIMEDEKILGSSIFPSNLGLEESAELALDKITTENDMKKGDIDKIVTTGYGRNSLPSVRKSIDEIYAKAIAVKWLGSPWGQVRTLIDIGGQDSKALLFDKNCELDTFLMNQRCAAGTGRFLEVMANALGVKIDELGELSMKSSEKINISSTCIVMAESEVISLIARKKKKEDIIAAIHRSVADRVGNLAKSVGVKEVVFFEGGPARNIGLKHALEEKLGLKLYIPPNPQITASIGAALEARRLLKMEVKKR